ncbi:hypothetical protein JKP88DRAFT_243120, partial [Tribonema minus]
MQIARVNRHIAGGPSPPILRSIELQQQQQQQSCASTASSIIGIATTIGMLRAPSADEEGLQSLVPAAEEALGYEFLDQMLLLQALTLKSYVNEVESATGDNGAMEWLGDCVLQHAVSDWLYTSTAATHRQEGRMTERRKAYVDTTACARYAQCLGLPRLLRTGAGASASLTSRKVQADAFEAVLGAVHLDCRDAAAAAVPSPVVRILAKVIRGFACAQATASAQRPFVSARLHLPRRQCVRLLFIALALVPPPLRWQSLTRLTVLQGAADVRHVHARTRDARVRARRGKAEAEQRAKLPPPSPVPAGVGALGLLAERGAISSAQLAAGMASGGVLRQKVRQRWEVQQCSESGGAAALRQKRYSARCAQTQEALQLEAPAAAVARGARSAQRILTAYTDLLHVKLDTAAASRYAQDGKKPAPLRHRSSPPRTPPPPSRPLSPLSRPQTPASPRAQSQRRRQQQRSGDDNDPSSPRGPPPLVASTAAGLSDMEKIRGYLELLDEFSLHHFVIYRGTVVDSTPEFASFKRTYAERWGGIDVCIAQLKVLPLVRVRRVVTPGEGLREAAATVVQSGARMLAARRSCAAIRRAHAA